MSSFINLLLLLFLLSLSMHARARFLRSVDEGLVQDRVKSKFDAAFLIHPHDGDLAKTIKGTKRLAQMMLQKALDDYEKMIDDSEENEAAEDLVAMDYAQPKKKPPIHN